MPTDIWFFTWIDRIEEIQWDEYRKRHEEDAGQFFEARGPFPTRELAEDARYRDELESYWEHNLSVYADHCLKCGKYAKVLAFDSAGGGWAWRVTECKQCGIQDSRVV